MLLFIACFPPLFLMYVIYRLDKHEREPLSVIAKVFVLGCLTVIPILIVGSMAGALFEAPDWSNFARTYFAGTLNIKLLLYAIFCVALIEEYFKYLVLTKYAYNRKAFNEPMDGIVYGVIASLGFALVENIVYVFYYANDAAEGMRIGILRMFTAIPAHALMGVIMGYYVGKAKFNRRNEKALMMKGLIGAITLHALYDYFLFLRNAMAIFAVASIVMAIVFARIAIKESQRASPFK